MFTKWGSSWFAEAGSQASKGGLEEEKGSLWTSRGAPEELQEDPKRYGNLHGWLSGSQRESEELA